MFACLLFAIVPGAQTVASGTPEHVWRARL
jgi:hypothetical protein